MQPVALDPVGAAAPGSRRRGSAPVELRLRRAGPCRRPGARRAGAAARAGRGSRPGSCPRTRRPLASAGVEVAREVAVHVARRCRSRRRGRPSEHAVGVVQGEVERRAADQRGQPGHRLARPAPSRLSSAQQRGAATRWRNAWPTSIGWPAPCPNRTHARGEPQRELLQRAVALLVGQRARPDPLHAERRLAPALARPAPPILDIEADPRQVTVVSVSGPNLSGTRVATGRNHAVHPFTSMSCSPFRVTADDAPIVIRQSTGVRAKSQIAPGTIAAGTIAPGTVFVVQWPREATVPDATCERASRGGVPCGPGETSGSSSSSRTASTGRCRSGSPGSAPTCGGSSPAATRTSSTRTPSSSWPAGERRVVARVAALENTQYNAHQKSKCAHFYFFDAEDDPAGSGRALRDRPVMGARPRARYPHRPVRLRRQHGERHPRRGVRAHRGHEHDELEPPVLRPPPRGGRLHEALRCVLRSPGHLDLQAAGARPKRRRPRDRPGALQRCCASPARRS